MTTLSLACALLAVGCGGRILEPTNARAEFQKDHPEYTVVYVGFPDGSAGTDIVTVPIIYKKPGDEREYRTNWEYEFKGGEYRLVRKGSETLFTASPEPARP